MITTDPLTINDVAYVAMVVAFAIYLVLKLVQRTKRTMQAAADSAVKQYEWWSEVAQEQRVFDRIDAMKVNDDPVLLSQVNLLDRETRQPGRLGCGFVNKRGALRCLHCARPQ